MSLKPVASDAAVESLVTPEPKPTAEKEHRTRVLTLDRSERRSGPVSVVSPSLRGLIERAVVDATNAWTASDPEATEGAAYNALSIIANAMAQIIAGGTPELQEWPRSTPIREPVDRLRRALLEST